MENFFEKNRLLSKVYGFNPSKKFYFIVLSVFICIFAVVSICHEPFLDEAESWLISRDASYYEMFFYFPRYEGHPPFWWLLLSIPAKMGAPYELSLTLITLIVSSLSVYLLLFKSPFHPFVKTLLPFTFYIFYQYGVIARPYCILVLAFFLSALFYEEKNQHPVKYVLSLILMCMTSAFGIVIAGCFAIIWCIEIITEFKSKKETVKFFKSARFVSLLFLLVFALSVIFMLVSADDVHVFYYERGKAYSIQYPDYFLRSRLNGLLYMLFMIPADCALLRNIGMKTNAQEFGYFMDIKAEIILFITGILILLYIIDLCYKKKKLLVMILPYVAFALFSVFVYVSDHHIGIIYVFFIFLIWICKNSSAERSNSLFKRFFPETKSLGSIYEAFLSVCVLFSGILLGISCSVEDIFSPFDFGRKVAEYIKENGYDDKNIMVEWYDDNTNVLDLSVSISPYFKDNIFMNLNNGQTDKAYIIHKKSVNYKEDYSAWSEKNPDILIGFPQLEKVYEDKIKTTDYIIGEGFEYCEFNEPGAMNQYVSVFVRKDLNDGK